MSDTDVDNRSYGERYALSGKIMLTAIVILFTVVLLIICLHIYARWFLARTHRRQQQLRERRRRASIIFTSDIPSTATISHGLDASLLKTLPTFIYSSTTHSEIIECAVCLSEFEENEKGRLLPKCNHSFHIGCIDMWFHSHSTCPLCRSAVEQPETQIEIGVGSAEAPIDCETSSDMGCSSSSSDKLPLGVRRKGFEIMGVSVEVPRRTEEVIQGSPVGVFKSPGGRIVSFKRLLTRDRRQSSSSSMSCSSALEIDLERGEIEELSVTPSSHRQEQKILDTSDSIGVGG